MSEEILILGIGNDILTDDGIGPKLIYKLQREISHPEVDFQTAATGGMEIIELIRNYEKVLIIDAIRTKGGIPGTIYYLTPSDFQETLHISSFHDVNFLTGLEMAKRIELSIPEIIKIIAIEIVEDLTFSVEFSPAIAEKYDDIYTEVLSYVKKFMEK